MDLTNPKYTSKFSFWLGFAGIDLLHKRLRFLKDSQNAMRFHLHFFCKCLVGPYITILLLEEHLSFERNIFDNMLRFLILEVLFIHINLVILKHALLCQIAECLDLCGKCLIFIHFFHESCILLLLSGVN